VADADKTTATDEVTPLEDAFATPCTIATKNAYGGWNKSTLPESGAGKGKGPGKNIGGNR
jgi:hypothetical protein